MKFSRGIMLLLQTCDGEHHHQMPNKTITWAEMEDTN